VLGKTLLLNCHYFLVIFSKSTDPIIIWIYGWLRNCLIMRGIRIKTRLRERKDGDVKAASQIGNRHQLRFWRAEICCLPFQLPQLLQQADQILIDLRTPTMWAHYVTADGHKGGGWCDVFAIRISATMPRICCLSRELSFAIDNKITNKMI